MLILSEFTFFTLIYFTEMLILFHFGGVGDKFAKWYHRYQVQYRQLQTFHHYFFQTSSRVVVRFDVCIVVWFCARNSWRDLRLQNGKVPIILFIYFLYYILH